jgi:hypothetical protein
MKIQWEIIANLCTHTHTHNTNENKNKNKNKSISHPRVQVFLKTIFCYRCVRKRQMIWVTERDRFVMEKIVKTKKYEHVGSYKLSNKISEHFFTFKNHKVNADYQEVPWEHWNTVQYLPQSQALESVKRKKLSAAMEIVQLTHYNTSSQSSMFLLIRKVWESIHLTGCLDTFIDGYFFWFPLNLKH